MELYHRTVRGRTELYAGSELLVIDTPLVIRETTYKPKWIEGLEPVRMPNDNTFSRLCDRVGEMARAGDVKEELEGLLKAAKIKMPGVSPRPDRESAMVTSSRGDLP